MVTALRVFAIVFFLIAGLTMFLSVAGGFNAVGLTTAFGITFSGVLCAAAANGLEALEKIEKHSRFIAEETLAMHRTIALNTPLKSAAE